MAAVINWHRGTGDPDPRLSIVAAAFERLVRAIEEARKKAEEFSRKAAKLARIASGILESASKFTPPIETGWPHPTTESAREGILGRSQVTLIYEVCGRYPSGYT
ncbi:hypothetical protein [Gimesia chilikensis]|uniref:hypothetical protein n=1 Tax=Gimesia chilikensis TaxID=2605989 RepID=UPI003A9078CD